MENIIHVREQKMPGFKKSDYEIVDSKSLWMRMLLKCNFLTYVRNINVRWKIAKIPGKNINVNKI